MTLLRRVALFLETIVFTLVVPGTVAFWLPPVILDRARFQLPSSWSVPQFLALIPLALGAAVYVRCVWEFATRGRGIPAPVDHPKALVVTGLYRYVRNPMYVAVVSVIFGQALLFGDQRLLIYGALFWLACHVFVIAYEEPTLARTFGAQYERYHANVPRWIPRLTAWRGGRR